MDFWPWSLKSQLMMPDGLTMPEKQRLQFVAGGFPGIDRGFWWSLLALWAPAFWFGVGGRTKPLFQRTARVATEGDLRFSAVFLCGIHVASAKPWLSPYQRGVHDHWVSQLSHHCLGEPQYGPRDLPKTVMCSYNEQIYSVSMVTQDDRETCRDPLQEARQESILSCLCALPNVITWNCICFVVFCVTWWEHAHQSLQWSALLLTPFFQDEPANPLRKLANPQVRNVKSPCLEGQNPRSPQPPVGRMVTEGRVSTAKFLSQQHEISWNKMFVTL